MTLQIDQRSYDQTYASMIDLMDAINNVYMYAYDDIPDDNVETVYKLQKPEALRVLIDRVEHQYCVVNKAFSELKYTGKKDYNPSERGILSPFYWL